MSAELMLLIFNYTIIPFVLAIFLTYGVLKGYQKLRYRSFWTRRADLLASNLEKQGRMQASQIEQMSDQLSGVYDKIEKIEVKIKEIQEMKNLLDDSALLMNDEGIKSHIPVTSPLRRYVSNVSDVMNTYNHNKKSQNHVQLAPDDDRRNGTVEYILRKLENTSLSTKEIQLMIGRTREHTSRLMKKLYDEKLVEREISNKPFKYTITDEGRRRLSKHSSLNTHYYLEHSDNNSSTDRLMKNQ
ncbi:helix-turn-helix domain-containing protein [Candidatus Nitrosocosmicus sp. FF01]|uniref:helix-turn-helix domain-containing protein n=1 Tax=Candidatus Nitrosocosmicus sp. FF01 TaxID=3397670 RepID=UPI0039EC428B